MRVLRFIAQVTDGRTESLCCGARPRGWHFPQKPCLFLGHGLLVRFVCPVRALGLRKFPRRLARVSRRRTCEEGWGEIPGLVQNRGSPTPVVFMLTVMTNSAQGSAGQEAGAQ